jgi:hypothetical protein
VEAVIRWLGALLVVLLTVPPTQATNAGGSIADKTVTVHGQPDGKIPGWGIATILPAGWTADCCQYAKAIGVDEVLYKGDWTGEPDRVMVLNVWPAVLPTLTAEWQADRTHYLKRDPLAKVAAFALGHPLMPCHALLYQGTDHIDDVVVFCDPGKASGVRLSWSMSVRADDTQRAQVLALFRRVVEKSAWMKFQEASRSAGHADRH